MRYIVVVAFLTIAIGYSFLSGDKFLNDLSQKFINRQIELQKKTTGY